MEKNITKQERKKQEEKRIDHAPVQLNHFATLLKLYTRKQV